MNKIRAIQALNKRELEHGIKPEASWHVDYRDTAFVYFGGLPYELSEGDVITIFSQFGEPVFLKLARDKETGKSRGFGWLKYEDQRSTDLAVDNLGGASIGDRVISVDHARYQPRDDEDLEEGKVGWEDMQRRERAEAGGGQDETASEATDTEAEDERRRPMLKEERELAGLIADHDDDDPMKEYLIEQKKEEVDRARQREHRGSRNHDRHHDRERRRHRTHRSKRDRSPDAEDAERRPRRRGHHDYTPEDEGGMKDRATHRRRSRSPKRERGDSDSGNRRNRHRSHRDRDDDDVRDGHGRENDRRRRRDSRSPL